MTDTPKEWTTRISSEVAARFGVGEIHAVVFKHNDDLGGIRSTVSVEIPETPPHQIDEALKHADAIKARVVFICDTSEQAVAIADKAASALRSHRRVAYEDAVSDGWI